jgi:hypothetical protein|tara:strand:+ start:1142 stop:1543 length:402 start_codon:yes stop_codon:yes gene_type:complete
MNSNLSEKLHLLGYQFWKEKNNLEAGLKENKNLLFSFGETLMVFCKKEVSEIPEEIFNHFILSINISINKNKDYSILPEVPAAHSIKKVVSFGDFNNLDIINDPSISLVKNNSLNELFNDPLLKKDLWFQLNL